MIASGRRYSMSVDYLQDNGAHKPWPPQGRSLCLFLLHEAPRSIATPPWMGCHSMFTGTHLYPWKKRDKVEQNILSKETMRLRGSNPQFDIKKIIVITKEEGE